MMTQERYLDTNGTLCVSCSSPDAFGLFISTEDGVAYQERYCPECKTSWTDIYYLAKYIRENEDETSN